MGIRSLTFVRDYKYVTFARDDIFLVIPMERSDERSFAYAQDDKGKEFGMTFFVFAILMIFFVFIIPGIFLLFLSFRGTIVTRNLILTSNKLFISILLVNRIKV